MWETAGKLAALLGFMVLLTVIGVVFEHFTGWDPTFLIGWWSCMMFYAMGLDKVFK